MKWYRLLLDPKLWVDLEYRNEQVWKDMWYGQIQDAVADRRWEDRLVEDMRMWLRRGALSPTECAQWLFEWESKRPTLLNTDC